MRILGDKPPKNRKQWFKWVEEAAYYLDGKKLTDMNEEEKELAKWLAFNGYMRVYTDRNGRRIYYVVEEQFYRSPWHSGAGFHTSLKATKHHPFSTPPV